MTRKPSSIAHNAGFRRFKFVDAKSSKFWEICMSGASVYVRYGKIGTEGQTQNTVFEEAAAAAKHADKLIAEKIGMEYQELTEIDSKKSSDSTTSGAALTCGSSYFHNI